MMTKVQPSIENSNIKRWRIRKV